jgi:hypothetical protein
MGLYPRKGWGGSDFRIAGSQPYFEFSWRACAGGENQLQQDRWRLDPPSGYQLDHQNNQRHDENQVNQRAAHVGQKAEQPENDQYH